MARRRRRSRQPDWAELIGILIVLAAFPAVFPWLIHASPMIMHVMFHGTLLDPSYRVSY